jgi:hypothetical protein
MKKAVLVILVVVLVLSIGVVSAFAAGAGKGNHLATQNGNGVCDRVRNEDGTCLLQEDSVCTPNCENNCVNNSCVNTSNCGQNFVDADGNGICDHCLSNGEQADAYIGMGNCGHRGQHHR